MSLRKPKKPKRDICVIDSETDPFRVGRVPKPFIWGFLNTNSGEYLEFTETRELAEYLAGQNVICYAHNGGKFDFHFLTDFIEDYEPITIIAGRLAKFRLGDCEMRDSYCIIPAPLSAYQKTEIDYSIFEESERSKPENWQLIRDYLKDDCVFLGEMVTEFIETYGLHLTQATAAMKMWEKISDIKKPDTSQMYYEEMSAFYYGGRVECFQKGIIEGDFSVVDINSAYPYAMIHEHPWGQSFGYTDDIEGWSDDKISRAFIEMEAESLGAFPIRTKDGLRFPSDGEMRKFYITGWEYLAARDTGTLGNHTINNARYYYDTVNFREYVDHFFAMKAEAGEMKKTYSEDHSEYGKWAAQYLFAKIFLNSLYGKFASNPANYSEYQTVPASMLSGAEEIEGWDFCKLLCQETAVVTRPLPDEKQKFYDVSVAASITGFVRAYLWRAIRSCEGVIYCDTDSIACRDFSGIEIGNELGQWDLEAQCDFGAVAGKKLYAFRKAAGTYKEGGDPWKIASKGVRLPAEEIVDIARGNARTYEPMTPTFTIRKKPIFTARKIRLKEDAPLPLPEISPNKVLHRF